MAATQIINPDPFCEVDVRPISVDGRDTNKCIIRLQNEEGQMEPIDCLGAVHNSESYVLVTNRRLQQAAEDVMTRSKLNFEPLPDVRGSKSSSTIWDGRRFVSRYFTRQVSADIRDNSGSRVMLGMQVTNSYDGSMACAMEFFLMNMVCANQFYSNRMITGFSLRHQRRGNNDIEFDLDDAVRAIEQQADKFGDILPHIKQMCDTPLGRRHHPGGNSEPYIDGELNGFLEFHNSLGKSWRPSLDSHLLAEMSGRGISSQLGGGFDSCSNHANLWGLLNAYTAVCTHHVGGLNGININRAVTDVAISRVAKMSSAA